MVESTLCIFVLFDTGETEFIEPFIRNLNPSDFCLVTFATAETLSIISTYSQIKHQDLNLYEQVSACWPREKRLKEEDIDKIIQKISAFKICISGVASVLQGQIVERHPGRTIMIWDNFKGNDTGFYWEVAQEVQMLAGEVIYPALSTYNELPKKSNKFHIIGHQSLEDWAFKVNHIDQYSIKLKLNVSKKIILYIAGWSGDPECFNGTQLFANICKNVLGPYLEDFEIIVQIHPRSNGNFERQEFQALALVNSREICTTEEVASIADVVICHKSTAGPKIVAAGKKLIFLVNQEGYTNKLIEKGICPLVKNEQEFLQELEKTIKERFSGDVFDAFEMPRNSINHFTKLVFGRDEYSEVRHEDF